MSSEAHDKELFLESLVNEPPAEHQHPSLLQFFALPLTVMTTLVAVAVFYVWSRFQIVDLGYELFEATNVYGKLTTENRKLKVELATLRSVKELSERVEALGLVRPNPEQVIRLSFSPGGEERDMTLLATPEVGARKGRQPQGEGWSAP